MPEVTCPKCGAVTPVFDNRQCGACQAPLPESHMTPLTTPAQDSNEAATLLRHALNELKAIGSPDEQPTDRDACAIKLRQIARYLELNPKSYIPDMIALLREAASIPVQQ